VVAHHKGAAMLGLDNNQKESIGLNHVLRQLAPASPYGMEKLRQIGPFSCPNAVNRCFDNMEKLMRYDLTPLWDILAHFKNMRGTLTKLAEGGMLNEIELFETKGFLLTLERFLPIFNEANTYLELADISFMPMMPALDILDPKKLRIATFSLDDGFSDDLATIRHERPWEEQVAEEMRIMSELSIKLRPHIPKFRGNMDNLGRLDLTMAKAALALRHNCGRPIIGKTAVIMQDMTNPRVAAALAENNRTMTPVSLKLDKGVTVITGANMGGKSVVIKTVALNAALCALGLFVFAGKAEIPLFDGIFLMTQDMQDTTVGLSSFGGEVARLNALVARLNSAGDFLFIALDEPARTTNPAEGAAIVRALTDWLDGAGQISLISTHYDNITARDARYYRVAGLAHLPQSLDQAHIGDYMDYRLLEAAPNDPIPRDALKICKLLGLDSSLMSKIEGEYLGSGSGLQASLGEWATTVRP
jgi:dsDNA-specific endonuclease/ATPase MutS2